MTEKNHLEISTEMQVVEKALKGLGVPLDKLEDILSQVENYQNLNRELQEARKKQFFNDAWTVMQIKKKESQVCEYLRSFAEYIALRTHDLLATCPDLSVDQIVDQIPPMETESPYDR